MRYIACILGVMNVFLKHLLWGMIIADAWDTRASTLEERQQASALRIHAGLCAFYAAYMKANPRRPLTEVPHFNYKLLGSNTRRKLRTKEAQAWGLLLFMCEEIPRRLAHLRRGGRWLAAAKLLVDFVQHSRCGADAPDAAACEDRGGMGTSWLPVFAQTPSPPTQK